MQRRQPKHLLRPAFRRYHQRDAEERIHNLHRAEKTANTRPVVPYHLLHTEHLLVGRRTPNGRCSAGRGSRRVADANHAKIAPATGAEGRKRGDHAVLVPTAARPRSRCHRIRPRLVDKQRSNSSVCHSLSARRPQVTGLVTEIMEKTTINRETLTAGRPTPLL